MKVRLFAWQAAKNVTFERIEVKASDSSFKWSHKVKGNEHKLQKVNYLGSAFKPGKYSYTLTYKKPLNGSIKIYTSEIKFRVIEDKNNYFISILNNYGEKHREKVNNQNIVIEQAKSLAEKGLFSDAVQEILLAKNTSGELSPLEKELRTNFCPKSII